MIVSFEVGDYKDKRDISIIVLNDGTIDIIALEEGAIDQIDEVATKLK